MSLAEEILKQNVLDEHKLVHRLQMCVAELASERDRLKEDVSRKDRIIANLTRSLSKIGEYSRSRELELRLKGKQAEYDDLLAYTLKLEQGIRSESAYAHMHSVALDEQNLKQEADKFKRMGDTLIALIRP